MPTFADLAHALNRPPVWLRGLQTRFALPVLEGAAYPAAYVAFRRAVAGELPHTRAAVAWARALISTQRREAGANE